MRTYARKMSWGETKLRNRPDLVIVNGLQFKKYQMFWIRDMAKKYNHGNVNEFIIDTVLTDLLIRLEKLYGKDSCRYPYPIREKLKEEGYKSSLEKVFKLSGVRDEVVLDDLEALT
jgi:hypothetical protein